LEKGSINQYTRWAVWRDELGSF